MSLITSADFYGYRCAPIVTSDEGKELQKVIWSEILEILEAASPGSKKLAGL